MDALSDVLRVVQLTGAVYLDGTFSAQYLAQWRLQLAAQQLRFADRPLASVAEDVGYESEAAFNRAFKREFGVPPATWRRNAASGSVADSHVASRNP